MCAYIEKLRSINKSPIYLFIYLLINIKIDKSVIPHQFISVIKETDIVLNKKEIIKKIKIKIKINEKKNKIRIFK